MSEWILDTCGVYMDRCPVQIRIGDRTQVIHVPPCPKDFPEKYYVQKIAQEIVVNQKEINRLQELLRASEKLIDYLEDHSTEENWEYLEMRKRYDQLKRGERNE